MTILILHPNRIDQATVSGGAWVSTLPLANVRDRIIKKVARTTNLALASTQFTTTLDRGRNIRALILVGHNMSPAATFRVTASQDSGFATLQHDSGWQKVYPSVFDQEDLEWTSDNFWTGQIAAEELDGIQQSAIYVLPSKQFARYWKWELNDTTNADGFIEIGRAFLSGEWQPSHNYEYGGSLGIETGTTVATSLAGTEYFDRREPYRVMRFALNYLDEDEAFQKGFDLMRRAGIDKEVFVIADPTDLPNMLRRSFLGRLRTLSPLEQSVFERANLNFEVKELL